jgi:hypothetical protein
VVFEALPGRGDHRLKAVRPGDAAAVRWHRGEPNEILTYDQDRS